MLFAPSLSQIITTKETKSCFVWFVIQHILNFQNYFAGQSKLWGRCLNKFLANINLSDFERLTDCFEVSASNSDILNRTDNILMKRFSEREKIFVQIIFSSRFWHKSKHLTKSTRCIYQLSILQAFLIVRMTRGFRFIKLCDYVRQFLVKDLNTFEAWTIRLKSI